MERLYRFADITFRITGKDDDMFREDGVLSPFRVDAPEWDHSVSFEIVDALTLPGEEPVFRGDGIRVYRSEDAQISYLGLDATPYSRICRQGSRTRVQAIRSEVPNRIMPRLVLNSLEAAHHIVRHGGILLHSSFIRVGDKAILFTAPSGTGKSTQAELWRKYRGAEVINGDRSALTVNGPEVTAHGIPYCGTSGICKNVTLPVAAIVCLSQAPENRIEPLGALRAFRQLWEGCTVNLWDREDVTLCTQRVTEILQRVPVLHLACTPDAAAVETLENYLQRGKQQYGSKF